MESTIYGEDFTLFLAVFSETWLSSQKCVIALRVEFAHTIIQRRWSLLCDMQHNQHDSDDIHFFGPRDNV